jgi:hypothetical protein
MRRPTAIFCLALALAVPARAAGNPDLAAPDPAADFVLPQPVEPLPEAVAAAVAGVDAPALAAHIDFLASPGLAGRGLGDRGLDAAAEYVAATLALAGIATPGADSGTRFQAVPVREISGLHGAVTVTRRSGDESSSRAFASGVDVLPPASAPQSITGAVVFAGHGIREADLDRDDYLGLEVRGRIVLILAGLPAGAEWQTEELRARWDAPDSDERYDARLEAARSRGAAAVLVVERDDWGARLDRGREVANRFFLPFSGGSDADDGPPLAVVSAAVADSLLGAGGGAAGLLPGVTVTISWSGNERLVETRNVLGVIPGADPDLRTQIVLVGAHLDHLGRTGDVTYPGADDNASGVAALLEIAKAFAASPVAPKRTVAFAFWAGEEEGKLGSGFYVRHPSWPLESTTYLNLDMIGHPWLPEEIAKLVADTGLERGDELLASLDPADFIELGLPDGAPALDAALRRAAVGTGITLHFDRTDGTGGGSDYRDFARAGVPFIRFFGNFFPAYHEPGDTAEALDAKQVQRVARLALATAWLLADR